MSPILLNRLSPLSMSEDRGLSVSEIAKSGVLVFRERSGKLEFLLLHRQKHNDWSFPKGHVEVGEGLLESGLREIYEEADVRPMVVGRLTDLEYLDGKNRQVRLALFLGYAEEKKYTPSVSSEGETAEWLPLDQVERKLSYENLRKYFRTYVKPLFLRKQTRVQVRSNIVFSETEPYKNGAKLLSNTLLGRGITSRCIELDRLIPDKEDRTLKRVCYFLSNHQNVPNAAFWCKVFGGYVVNGEYLRFCHSKSQVQGLLEEYGVPVLPSEPYLFSDKKHDSTWMVKSERHGMSKLMSIKGSKFSSWDVYLEQIADEKRFTEVKLGYVAGQILAESEDLNIPSDLINALRRVQECLGLEVFSVNIFVDQGGAFYIIDVNPAPAFYRNAKARQNFAIYIQLIGKLYLE